MAAYVISGPSRGVSLRRTAGIAGIALLGLGLAACGKLGLGGGGGDQMSWARAALERNNRLEVVASDPQTATFTVRVKDTGELRMIRVDEVVGAPPPGAAASSPSAAPSETSTPASTEPPVSEGPGTSATASATSAPEGSSTPPAAASAGSEPVRSMPVSPGESGTGASEHLAGMARNVSRTGFHSEPAPAVEAPNPNGDVASITPGGRTLESGPGYVIKAASKGAQSAGTGADRQQSATTTAALERRHDPIICQGDRLLQIDNRNLEFDGDAVTAEDGCEIHITNSHITAKGVGVSARAANVHIDNSQIEGDVASVDASDGSQVYASSSRFKGISRRLDKSAFHDMGGNVWN